MALHSESALLSGCGEDEYKIQSKDLQGAVNDLGQLGTIDIVPDMVSCGCMKCFRDVY